MFQRFDVIFQKGYYGITAMDYHDYIVSIQQFKSPKDAFNKYIRHYLPYVIEFRTKTFLEFGSETQNLTILKQIQQIKFPFLEKLSFVGCQLESIEILSRIYMPSMESLYFTNNKITTVRIYKKMNSPNLKNIYLCDNKIEEYGDLIKLHSPELRVIYINDFENEIDIKKNFQWIIKLQTLEIQYIRPFLF